MLQEIAFVLNFRHVRFCHHKTGFAQQITHTIQQFAPLWGRWFVRCFGSTTGGRRRQPGPVATNTKQRGSAFFGNTFSIQFVRRCHCATVRRPFVTHHSHAQWPFKLKQGSDLLKTMEHLLFHLLVSNQVQIGRDHQSDNT